MNNIEMCLSEMQFDTLSVLYFVQEIDDWIYKYTMCSAWYEKVLNQSYGINTEWNDWHEPTENRLPILQLYRALNNF